jgi:tRNA modification GTPase
MIREDTICAISTPSGTGGIAVIRCSGDNSIKAVERILDEKSKSRLKELNPNAFFFGNIVDKDRIIDEVIVSFFKAPHSYTGEDILEISCHGSVYVQKEILSLLLKNGSRAAQPGEFTMRAFLNGKIDLSQAEGVADLISCNSRAAHRLAIEQMRGGFSHEINLLRNKLLHFVSLIELELDFSEEDVEFADRKELKNLIIEIKNKTDHLTDSFQAGNVIKNGLPVVITGNPNVGKSTLLNSLLNEEKAIVTEIPGTTRDVIEDVISIKGFQFRFIDTAGIRDSDNRIEAIGIERTFEKISQASIILLVTQPDEEISGIYSKIRQYLTENKKLIIVHNKTDIAKPENTNAFLIDKNIDQVFISAKYKTNFDELISKLIQTAEKSMPENFDTIVSNARHYDALQKTSLAIERIISGFEQHTSFDFIALDIREAIHYLGEITGEISNNEVLENIFKNFCIGK